MINPFTAPTHTFSGLKKEKEEEQNCAQKGPAKGKYAWHRHIITLQNYIITKTDLVHCTFGSSSFLTPNTEDFSKVTFYVKHQFTHFTALYRNEVGACGTAGKGLKTTCRQQKTALESLASSERVLLIHVP